MKSWQQSQREYEWACDRDQERAEIEAERAELEAEQAEREREEEENG